MNDYNEINENNLFFAFPFNAIEKISQTKKITIFRNTNIVLTLINFIENS